jgi:hypothetical protein
MIAPVQIVLAYTAKAPASQRDEHVQREGVAHVQATTSVGGRKLLTMKSESVILAELLAPKSPIQHTEVHMGLPETLTSCK